MAVTVRIPTILRTYTGDSSEVTLTEPGATLGSALAALEITAPGIQARILDDDGALRRFVNVYVNDEDIRFMQGLGTALKAGDEVSIVPAMAGGV